MEVTGLYSVAKPPGEYRITNNLLVLFIGVILTGFCSMYYHWQPIYDTPARDLIPMTIVFMAIRSATVSNFRSI